MLRGHSRVSRVRQFVVVADLSFFVLFILFLICRCDNCDSGFTTLYYIIIVVQFPSIIISRERRLTDVEFQRLFETKSFVTAG